MTADAFRKLALKCEGATEGSHHGHADFRIRNKIFATLPNAERGVVRLTAEQQQVHMASVPETFSPCPGSWGARGWTFIELRRAKAGPVNLALSQAAKNV